MRQTPSNDPAQVVLATGFVAVGALAGIWAASGLIVGAALIALLRICWLEDNINNDLYGRDQPPQAYLNTAIQRGNFLRRWLGLHLDQDVTRQSAHQLATEMRAEIQVWGAILLGLTATLTAQFGPFGVGLNLILAGLIFVMGLRRVDRLLVSLAHCANGMALPRDLLLPARQWLIQDDDPR